ncbi:MAG: hypothetical protein KAW47_01485 [Thermoplasmatales archaeon]|nr:hypothetical protein [Thermoplasmatales archaeon]
MKNAVIWGFDSESAAQAINMLKEKNIIDAKAWIGDAPESTHDVISFLVGDFNKDLYYGRAQNIYDEILRSSIYQFMDMMSRHSFYAEKSFHDYLNIFNMQFDLFSNLLTKNNIDVVLFSNLPHEGPDLVLYKIAKKLNVKTILFYQTIFPNKFFYLFDVEDFGKFNEIEHVNERPNVKIEKKHEKNLFYTANNKQYKYGIFSLQRSSFGSLLVSLLVSLFKRKNYLVLKSFLHRYFKYNVKKNVSLSSKHQIDLTNKCAYSPSNLFSLVKELLLRVKTHSKRFLQRYSNYRESKRNLLDILTKQIDLTKKFVYFPLHMQPELTTSGLGGIYVDQLLAIERLSKVIPVDWCIYVKENPVQTELMRGKWFFSRLRLIKNVKVVSPDFDTYSLIKNSIFVATITGTAGWEAISGGKNTLVFGNAWYKTLPGVFSYDEDFELEDILEYKINHDELERELNLLLSKTGDGVIGESYSVMVENFNTIDNASNIATFIERLIK